MAQQANALVVSYLKGEPLNEQDRKRRRATHVWYGFSTMRNSTQIIKELCAASDDGSRKTMWDQERKLWGTLRLENVVSLIASGMWAPNGLPPSMKNEVATEAKRTIDAARSTAIETLEVAPKAAEQPVERRDHEAGMPRRKRKHTPESMEEVRKRTLRRVEEIKQWHDEQVNGPHAKALAFILERSMDVPIHKPPYARACATCHAKPIEQFMECGCSDDTSRHWERCDDCNCIWHRKKMKCMCI